MSRASSLLSRAEMLTPSLLSGEWAALSAVLSDFCEIQDCFAAQARALDQQERGHHATNRCVFTAGPLLRCVGDGTGVLS